MAAAERPPIVYVTSGILGYLYRFVPIGRELGDRGHQVVVVSASGTAVEHARLVGFAVHHLDRQEAALDAVPHSEWPPPWDRLARRIPGVSLGPRTSAGREWERRSAVLGDGSELAAVLEGLDPALVLTEVEEHRDIRVVMALGFDLMLFEDLYSTRPGPDVPFPARSHQVPDGSWGSRVRARARWERFFALEAIRRRAERRWVDGYDMNTTLDRLGAAAGLSGSAVRRRYLQFFDYPAIPHLRTVAPELAFPGEPQPPIVVGPVVDPDRQVHDVDAEFDAGWRETLGRRAEGARIVYVSLGTFLSGLEDLTRTVIEATRAIPRTEVVVSVGRDRDRWRGVDTADNVAVYGRVPQMTVLADTDAVVSTGGLNTGHEALWFGLPVLNLPVAGLDTRGNAARIAYHGAGLRLTPAEISIGAVRDGVVRILGDAVYRKRAEELGERIRRRDAVGRAVAAIESRLAGG